MNICANFSSDECTIVKLSMADDNDMVITKTVPYNSFKDAINKCSSVDNYSYCRVNMLPTTFLDGYFVTEKSLTGQIALFLPGQLQRMAYENGKDAAMVPYPSLIFFFSVVDGRIMKSLVFSTKEQKASNINDSTPLYNFPYGNVSPYDGRICWGSNAISVLKSYKDLDSLVVLFINSPTNNDLYQKNQSVSKNVPFLSIIKSQVKRKTFDKELLVSAKKTVADLLLTTCKF